MSTIHPFTGQPCESAECPYCHETFYAPPLHDPLRKHVDYCPDAPENEGPEQWGTEPCATCGYIPPCQCPGNPFGSFAEAST